MKLLLDTQAFLWWVSADERLPARARRGISSPRNDVFVSAASVWEIAIKAPTRQFDIQGPIDRVIPDHISQNGFEALPVSVTHALAVSRLPSHHRDPFDRILIAQAIVEGLTLVSGDRHMKRYAIKMLW